MKHKLIKTLRRVCSYTETEQVFVYETLLSDKLRKKLLKRDTKTYVDKIIGYREVSIATNEGPNYHTLLPEQTSSVMGKRFTVTREELRILDNYEDEYIRKRIQLASDNIAWVYLLRVDCMSDKGHNLDIPN